MPFITAGDPNYAATKEIILECERRGADLIELGVPFSDPIADGPTIQASYTRALSAGATVEKTLDMVRALRRTCRIPLVAMVSYSIVFKRGPQRYFAAAARAGLDGAIIPDLPIEEGRETARIARDNGMHLIFLVAPSTPPARRKKIARLSSGFIYCVSVMGITGARDTLPPDLVRNIQSIKKLTDTPVALGFGVSKPDQARIVARHADGVIVGSAIIKLIDRNRKKTPRAIARTVGSFVSQLVRGTKGATK